MGDLFRETEDEIVPGGRREPRGKREESATDDMEAREDVGDLFRETEDEIVPSSLPAVTTGLGGQTSGTSLAAGPRGLR